MRTNQQVTDITGTAAQVWGNTLIPSRGTIAVRINGDTLQATVKTGLEKKESWMRIQNVDSIEILEAPIYALLVLGAFIALSGLGSLAASPAVGLIFILIGVAIIMHSINNKRRYLAIYSHRNAIPVFMNKSPETYQQFAANVLTLSRQLNSPVNAPARQPQPQPQTRVYSQT